MNWDRIEEWQPREGQRVLAFMGTVLLLTYRDGVFYDGYELNGVKQGIVTGITHWMDLPETPS